MKANLPYNHIVTVKNLSYSDLDNEWSTGLQ